jgi:epoxyqueuosine reductase
LEDLVAQLRTIGLANGLTAVGVAPAAPFTRARIVLEERKEAGLHGGMHFTYGDPARSTDPGRALPGAAAIVVGAYRYLRGEAPAGRDAAAVAGRVARYSWQDHYAPLRDALDRVADALVAAGWRARVLADDNALVDREAAYRAGLGWYGKNANVLLPGHGSWFVLGSVVTDAPLPSAEPLDDGCGACVRCFDACPTGAIVAPGVVDARRCLAWLLEAPGVFPVEHRVALGDRIYGCDDCQEVCPPNRTAARHDPPAAASAADEPWVDLLGLLDATDDALLDHFGRWYIPRRQPRFLRRNALIALGNTGDGRDDRVVAALGRALSDPDPIVRGHAVWATARLGRADLLPEEDGDTGVRAELEAVAAGAVPSTTTPARGTPRNV